MTKNRMQEHQTFEEIKQTSRHGAEYWMARNLSKILGYSEFRNFLPVIEKAKKACKNSGQTISDHFVEMHEMVDIGSGVKVRQTIHEPGETATCEQFLPVQREGGRDVSRERKIDRLNQQVEGDME